MASFQIEDFKVNRHFCSRSSRRNPSQTEKTLQLHSGLCLRMRRNEPFTASMHYTGCIMKRVRYTRKCYLAYAHAKSFL